MQFNCTTVLLSTIALLGTGMCCICGYMALDGTLQLFEEFGPLEGRGNPALDDLPNYYLNSKTGQQELLNPNVPGNILPFVFRSVQYYLIGLGIFMVVNIILFFVVTSLIQRSFYNAVYNRVVSSWTLPRYTALLIGYTAVLALIWFITSCYAVIPLVEYVITIQRCHDLINPNYASKKDICVNLVQYGLVRYREMHNSGYGLICGSNPYQWGDLEGLCKNYNSNFNLYIVCFAGACLVLIAMVMYAMRAMPLYFQLKSLFAEPRESYKQPHDYQAPHPTYAETPFNHYGNSVHNPNYENNVLLADPLLQASTKVDGGSYRLLNAPPGSDGAEMKKRYFSDAGDHTTSRRSEKSIARSSSSSTTTIEEAPHAFTAPRAPAYQSSKLQRHPSTDSMENVRSKSSMSDVNRKNSSRRRVPTHQISSELDSENQPESSDAPSEVNRSATAYRPKPLKRKARSTRSDPDIYRKSGRRAPRKKVPTIDEYDSPPSDYYIQEDMQRRTVRLNSRTRSVY